MPAVGGFLLGVLQAGGIGASLLKITASLVVQFALAKITAPKGPRPQELQTEARSSNAQRIRYLGQARASGTILFYDWNYTNGPRRLFKLLAISSGGIHSIQRWYLNGEPVDVDAQGYVTTHPWNKGNVRLQWRSGVQNSGEWDGGAFPELQNNFGGQWNEDYRARGVGCVLAAFDAVSGETIGEVYSGGDPEVSCLFVGAETYWAFADSTLAFNHSPAVHLSDVLAHPTLGPMTRDDLNLASFNQARLACAEAAPTSSGSRQKYRSGLGYAESEAMKETAQKLLDAMGGRAWIDPDGKLAVEAGVWIPPTVTIQEHHIASMQYDSGVDVIDRVTTLVPTYVAPETHWQETSADPWEDQAVINRWGAGQPKGMDLLAVYHHGQAAHLAKQQMARLNPPRRMSLTLRMFGLKLVGERKVAVNIPRLGLNNTPFWIDAFGFDGSNIQVELIEAVPESFDFTAAEEGIAPAPAPVVTQASSSVEMTIDNVSVVTNDGPPYIAFNGYVTRFAQYAGFEILAEFRGTDYPNWVRAQQTERPAGAPPPANGWDAVYAFRTLPLADQEAYDIRVGIGRQSGGTAVSWAFGPFEVSDISVVVSPNPPAEPVITSSLGSAGGTLSVTFEPDLGANYRRTGLYRSASGGVFNDATLIRFNYATSSEVTMNDPIPAAGAKYWLQSENPSGIASNPVLIDDYPA